MPTSPQPSGSPSAPMTLNTDDFKKIGKGAAIAAAGAVIAYLSTEVIPNLDENNAVAAGLACVLSIAINFARKFLAGPK